MKFLCLGCDEQMTFAERRQPGDGTFAAAFTCPRCGRAVALLANPMETQLVSALGVRIGGSELDPAPMETARTIAGRAEAFVDARVEGARVEGTRVEGTRTRWSPAAQERLSRVPSFVRGMVKRIYADFARERGIEEITPAVMDRARTELGMEGL